MHKTRKTVEDLPGFVRQIDYSHSTASLLSPLFLGFFLYLSYHYYLKIPLEKMEYQF